MLMPTPSARLPMVFPRPTHMSLAMEPLATVASMVDTTVDTTEDTTEAMLDTLEPTTAKFTLSSHHHFA